MGKERLTGLVSDELIAQEIVDAKQSYQQTELDIDQAVLDDIQNWADQRFSQLSTSVANFPLPLEPNWAADFTSHKIDFTPKAETLTSKLLPTAHPSDGPVDVLLGVYDEARNAVDSLKNVAGKHGVTPRRAIAAGTVAVSLFSGATQFSHDVVDNSNAPTVDGLRISRTTKSTIVELGDVSKQLEEPSKAAVASVLDINPEDQEVEGSELVLPVNISDEQAVTAAIAYLAPDTAEGTSTNKVESSVEIPPAVKALNDALENIDLHSDTIDLSAVRDAVIDMDAWFAPEDKDRMDNMPSGYVKVLLPDEAVGLSVPMTVAERTADVERYTSPTMAAVDYASAKLMQQLITEKYPQLSGSMWRLRDHQAPAHKTHNDGRQADVSSSIGFEVTQYSDGPFADFQFSDNFNKQFTIEMFEAMSKLSDEEGPVISSILSSGVTMTPEVNSAVGSNFIQRKSDHKDHGHLTLQKRLALPQWRPRAADLPWSVDQDLRIAGMAQDISLEQHASQHADYEAWVTDNLVGEPQPTNNDMQESENNLEMPENLEVEPLDPDAGALISQLNLPEGHKQFLRKMVPSITTVYRNGAKINPVVALTQTSLETGYGQDRLSPIANNFFGIKAGSKWGGDVLDIDTLEEYTAGSVVTITDGFRVYPNAASSVADYARLIQSRDAYADAVRNYQSIEGYTNGLFNEVDDNGNITAEQGSPGVSSYGTDRGYEQKIFTVIEKYGYQDIIQAQLNSEVKPIEPSVDSQNTSSSSSTTTIGSTPNENTGIVKEISSATKDNTKATDSELVNEAVITKDLYVDEATAKHIYEVYFKDDEDGLNAWVQSLPQIEDQQITKYGININNTPDNQEKGDK